MVISDASIGADREDFLLILEGSWVSILVPYQDMIPIGRPISGIAYIRHGTSIRR
jgi:hypothetical protein